MSYHKIGGLHYFRLGPFGFTFFIHRKTLANRRRKAIHKRLGLELPLA